jgi:trehalose 6-phosphate phosphatase
MSGRAEPVDATADVSAGSGSGSGSADSPGSGLDQSLQTALKRAARAPTLLVASDFDGALADFTLHPQDATPAPGAMSALRGLAALPRTFVAVVSGRDIQSLRHATGVGSAEPITLIGSHGAESTRPEVGSDGRLDGAQRRPLEELTLAAAQLIERHPGARLERKRAAVAVHTRGLPEDDADAALREAAALAEGRSDVRLLRGKSVVELSVSHADKGRAITLLSEVVGSDATFYAGDDVTDEDAFRALKARDGDVSVKVGGGDTHAAYRVSSVSELVETLERLRRLREQATEAGAT